MNSQSDTVAVAAREIFNTLGLQEETKRKTLQNTDILRDLLEIAIIAGMQIQAKLELAVIAGMQIQVKEVIKKLEEIQRSAE